MTQFDRTTEAKAMDLALNSFQVTDPERDCCCRSYKKGRNSTRESLEILARAIESCDKHGRRLDFPQTAERRAAIVNTMNEEIYHAIAAVKARGDWPLSAGEGE